MKKLKQPEDKRYTIAIECVGNQHDRYQSPLPAGQAYVVRFCGDFLVSSLHQRIAEQYVDRHKGITC